MAVGGNGAKARLDKVVIFVLPYTGKEERSFECGKSV